MLQVHPHKCTVPDRRPALQSQLTTLLHALRQLGHSLRLALPRAVAWFLAVHCRIARRFVLTDGLKDYFAALAVND